MYWLNGQCTIVGRKSQVMPRLVLRGGVRGREGGGLVRAEHTDDYLCTVRPHPPSTC